MSDYLLSDFERRILREADRISDLASFQRVPRGILLGSLCAEHPTKDGDSIFAPGGNLDTAIEKLRIAGLIETHAIRPRLAMHTRPDGKQILVKCTRVRERDADFGAPCYAETVTIDGELPPVHWELITEQRAYTLTRDGIREARAKLTGAEGEAGRGDPNKRHSADFRSVHWHGTDYSFTALQAACVKELWGAMENGTPEVGMGTILEITDSATSRLVDIFRGSDPNKRHPAWGTLIVDGTTKGTKRLACPPKI